MKSVILVTQMIASESRKTVILGGRRVQQALLHISVKTNNQLQQTKI